MEVQEEPVSLVLALFTKNIGFVPSGPTSPLKPSMDTGSSRPICVREPQP